MDIEQPAKERKGRLSRVGRRQRKRKRDKNEQYIASLISELTLEEFPRRGDDLALSQVRAVTRQLGYKPLNIISVAACDAQLGADHPQVALLYPLNFNNNGGRYKEDDTDLKPFPTIYWMTCPKLRSRISKLETLGYIEKFQEKLVSGENSAEWLEMMRDSNRRYSECRWELLSEEDKVYIEEKGWISSIVDVGIAGIRDYSSVKCLHCHYSHHLSRPDHGNIVGMWIHEQLMQESLQELEDDKLELDEEDDEEEAKEVNSGGLLQNI